MLRARVATVTGMAVSESYRHGPQGHVKCCMIFHGWLIHRHGWPTRNKLLHLWFNFLIKADETQKLRKTQMTRTCHPPPNKRLNRENESPSCGVDPSPSNIRDPTVSILHLSRPYTCAVISMEPKNPAQQSISIELETGQTDTTRVTLIGRCWWLEAWINLFFFFHGPRVSVTQLQLLNFTFLSRIL